MSSLWSLFAKKKIRFLDDIFSDREAAMIVGATRNEKPKLVNISDFANHFAHPEGGYPENYRFSLDATPCFPALWLEWMAGSERQAISVMRCPPGAVENAAHQVAFCMWTEMDGTVQLWATSAAWVDRMGCPIAYSKTRACADDGWEEWAIHEQILALEVLTAMNTRGTVIEPPFDAKPTEIVKPNRAPCSVWHTIRLPRMPSLPLQGAEISGTMLERREHWVRAHRKDYRRGAGMFGRVKALVWMPEHRRGNPELGTVKQSYEVAAR